MKIVDQKILGPKFFGVNFFLFNRLFSLYGAYIPNLSFLLGLEPLKKFVVGGGGGGWWWLTVTLVLSFGLGLGQAQQKFLVGGWVVGGWWVGGGVESKFSVQLRPKLNNNKFLFPSKVIGLFCIQE